MMNEDRSRAMRLSRRSWMQAAAAAAVHGAHGLATGSSQASEASDTDDALRAIATARADVRTLTARFSQRRAIGLLAAEVKSEGRLWLVRPDKLRWELAAPDAVTYWIGPFGLAVRSADGVTKVGKAAAGRFGAVLDDLLVMLGGDLRTLAKRYAIEHRLEGSARVLAFSPTDAELKKRLTRLVLRASADEPWRVTSIELFEPNGDKSDIAFTHAAKNEPIDPSVMKPPAK